MSVSAVSRWICGGDHKRKTCQFLQSVGEPVEEIITGRPVSFCSQWVDLRRRS